MKKFLIKASYNAQGIKKLIEDGGPKRKSAIEKMLTALGGKMESFYFSMGKYHVYVIAQLPDDISATAVELRINASGLVTISSAALLSPEDLDAAINQTVSYQAPGEK